MKRSKNLKFSEDSFTQNLKSFFSNNAAVCGIGDDAAVYQTADPSIYQLATVDAFVEGVHFNRKSLSFFEVGRKALAVNVSDIAAMGGHPLTALISLGWPSNVTPENIDEFYAGFKELADQLGITVTGGNVARDPHHFWASITLLGEVPKAECKLRTGASAGDCLYVTGTLGKSALGLKQLELNPSHDSEYVTAHKQPPIRLKEAALLGKMNDVTCMMDVSDGLATDLKRLCDANGLGAVLNEKALLSDPHFIDVSKKMNLDPLDLILTGGEDYELLFAVKSVGAQRAVPVEHAIQIGFFTNQKGILEIENSQGQRTLIAKKGYDHLS